MVDKAYIVSRGAYSDYRVVAVFTDKEKAEEYKKNSNDAMNYSEDDWDAFRVEEQRLNPEPTDYNKYAWAEVNKQGQVVQNWGSRQVGASGTRKNIYESGHRGPRFSHRTLEEEEPTVTVKVPGHDTDKAVRKAKEIAEKAQEEGWWGDDEKLKEVLKE